jgi:1,4-dihydroxy-2-naphthoyl-CoA synthase
MSFSGGRGGNMGTCAWKNRKEAAMSEYPDILYDVKDRVATITLNRPDRLNAYTARMASNIKQAMAQAAGDLSAASRPLAGR